MTPELTTSISKAAAVLIQAGAREVFVFGSAAKENMRPGSDVDLAVRGLPPKDFFPAMARAEDALGLTLDLLDLDEPGPFQSYLLKSGELRRVA